MERETDFLDFLIRAKRETYASQGDDASVQPVFSGSRQLEYKSGDFFYRDIYFGMSYFIGQEIVYFEENPIWSMAYSGGVEVGSDMNFVKEVYAFLRGAMSQVSFDNPYRGPKEFSKGDFVFMDKNQGHIGQFAGEETIYFQHDPVYTLRYSGGFIR